MDGMIEADVGDERSSLLDGEEVIEQEKRSKKSETGTGSGGQSGGGGSASKGSPGVNLIEKFDYRKRASFTTHFIDMLWVVDQDEHSGITNLEQAHDLMIHVIEKLALAAQDQKINLKMGLVTGHGGGTGELSSQKKNTLNKLLRKRFQTSLITHNQGFHGYRRTKVLVDGVMYLTKNHDFIRFNVDGTKQNIIVFVTQDDSKHYPKPKKGWFNSIWIAIGAAVIVLTAGAAAPLALTTTQIIAGSALGSAAVVGGLIQNRSRRDEINRKYEKLSRADRYQSHLTAKEAGETLDGLMGVAGGGNYEVWSIVGDAPRKIHKNQRSLGRKEVRPINRDWKLTTQRGFKTSYVLANNSSDINRKFTLKNWNAGGRQGAARSETDVKQVLDRKNYRLKNDRDKATCLDTFKVPNLSGCRAMCEVYYTSAVPEYQGNKAYYDGLNQGVTSNPIWLEMISSGNKVRLDIHEEEDFDIQIAKFEYEQQGQTRVRYFWPSSMMKDLHPNVCHKIGQVRGVLPEQPEQRVAKILFDSGLHPQPMCMQVCPNKGPYSTLPKGSTGGCKRRKGWEYIKLVEQTGGISFTPCESRDKASRQLVDKVLTSSAAIFKHVGVQLRLKEAPAKIVDINIFDVQGQSVFKGYHEVRKTVVKDINRNPEAFFRERMLIVPTTRDTVEKLVEERFIRRGGQRHWERFVEKYTAVHDKSIKQKIIIEYQKRSQPK